VSIVLNPARLERELARRALTSAELAKAAGVSGATVTAARSGRPLSPRTVRRIVTALSSVPPIEEIETLLL